jgi:hypothetical protein
LTAYYTHDGSSPFEHCRNQPEWDNLVCGIYAAAHPSGHGLPGVPMEFYEYDRFGQVAAVKEYFSSAAGPVDTRTTRTTFDPAGRPIETSIESSVGHAVEEVTAGYDSSTGIERRPFSTSRSLLIRCRSWRYRRSPQERYCGPANDRRVQDRPGS